MTGLVAFLDSWWWLLALAGAVTGLWLRERMRAAAVRCRRILDEELNGD